MSFGAWYAQTIRQVDLRMRERVQTLMQGMHRSTFRGRGEDFEFFQPHALGEEISHIDWKASERLEEGFLVRRRREERVLEVWIAADLSASIGTGFAPESCKQRLLLEVMAVVGRSVIHQQDLLGFIGFDHTVRMVQAPFRSEKTFVNLLNMLWDFQPTPGQSTAVLPALQFFAAHQGTWQRQRLVLVLSDFETEEDWMPVLQRLRASHPIVPVFLEETVPEHLRAAAGLMTYRDVESGTYATVDSQAWWRVVQEHKNHARTRYRTQCEASGIQALFVSRDTFSVDALIALLEELR